MKKKAVILILILILIFGILGVFLYNLYSKPDLVSDTELATDTAYNSDEYREIAFGAAGTTEKLENEYDLDTRISDKATIVYKGNYNKKSTSVTCVITAPDVYSYVMDNIDSFSELESKEIYEKVIEYINNDEVKTKETEVTVNASYSDGKLVIDTSSFEYQDAIHGGLNSALTDLFIDSISTKTTEP